MRTKLPQGGFLYTDGPFRMTGIQANGDVYFEPLDKPELGTTVVHISELTDKCNWPREYFEKARGNMQYFLHTVIEKEGEPYIAVSCWSPGKYTLLKMTPLLQSIIDKEEEDARRGIIKPDLVKHSFIPEYMLSGPFSSYVNMCDLSKSKEGKRKRLPVLKVGLKKKTSFNTFSTRYIQRTENCIQGYWSNYARKL